MLRKVYLEGDLGQKFTSNFTVEAETLQDVLRCADVNFSGFKKYLMDCHENDIGFIIDVADAKVEEDVQLLLPIKSGDITITPVPAGSKGIGKILAAMAIITVLAISGGWAAAGMPGGMGMGGAALGATPTLGTQAVSFSSAVATAATGSLGGLMAAGLAINLAMTGIAEMMAPDPATDGDQESSYMFNGAEQNVIEGDPVPVLYGQLQVPGQPISFDTISSTYNPITGTGNYSNTVSWGSPEKILDHNHSHVDPA